MLLERLDLPVCLLALISLHINGNQGILTSAVDMKDGVMCSRAR
jgi:hypothetical protein